MPAVCLPPPRGPDTVPVAPGGALALRTQYSIVQYGIVQYSTVQYSTVQYSTVQYRPARRGTRCRRATRRPTPRPGSAAAPHPCRGPPSPSRQRTCRTGDRGDSSQECEVIDRGVNQFREISHQGSLFDLMKVLTLIAVSLCQIGTLVLKVGQSAFSECCENHSQFR